MYGRTSCAGALPWRALLERAAGRTGRREALEIHLHQTEPERNSLSGGLQASFEDLVASFDRRIYNLVLRLVGNEDDAADITQETFVRAFAAWEGFEGRSAPYTWLCQIAINLCKNRARDGARWDDEPVSEDNLESVLPSPAEEIERLELRDRVRRAIDSLPPAYRIVTVLRDLQGLTYQEISEASGLSVDVIKTRLARARAMLRRKLHAYLAGGGPPARRS